MITFKVFLVLGKTTDSKSQLSENYITRQIHTNVVDELFKFGLHSPIPELHFAELVGTHD